MATAEGIRRARRGQARTDLAQALRVISPGGSNARRVLELTGFPAPSVCEQRESALAEIEKELPLRKEPAERTP